MVLWNRLQKFSKRWAIPPDWCAAGKKTFSTQELVKRITAVSLDKVVFHKRVIVPQLGATGVSARQVRELSGFRVVKGPMQACDIPAFLTSGRKADKSIRQVTFSLFERFVLTSVELHGALKMAGAAALVLFVLSGIGPGIQLRFEVCKLCRQKSIWFPFSFQKLDFFLLP